MARGVLQRQASGMFESRATIIFSDVGRKVYLITPIWKCPHCMADDDEHAS